MLKISNTNTLCHQVATYTSGSQLEWREVEGGQLPKPRWGLRAATVDNVIFVTGGVDDNNYNLTSILSWDPLTESWQQAGDLKVARSNHAAVANPSLIIDSEYTNKTECVWLLSSCSLVTGNKLIIFSSEFNCKDCCRKIS